MSRLIRDNCGRKAVVLALLAGGVLALVADVGWTAGKPTYSSTRKGRRKVTPNKQTAAKPFTLKSLTSKTLGGRQFWGDVAYFHDWRIQKNTFFGQYRLLDGNDERHCSGTLQACRNELAAICKKRKLPAMNGKAVILAHGIIRSSKSFRGMRDELQKQGYLVIGFDYPSTQISITEAAQHLASVIESLEGIEQIDFVVHSMGGLVVRAYLAKHADKRIKRMVMMGVPNLGAKMADQLKKNPLYKLFYGPAGQQLVSSDDGLIAKLPTPKFEFAIIAGGKGTINGYNPIIPGDDDGTVQVASTRLPGAADFMTVRCLHSFLMFNDEAVASTVRFLDTGRLRAKGEPHPIPRPKKSADAPK
jgi:pimeloyl-ACP methyl ester carboxylesterase